MRHSETSKPLTQFKRVMIIDDEEVALFVTSHLVIQHSFGKEVMEYVGAADALKFLHDHQHDLQALPQVIFTDIHMPGMNGFLFLEGYDKLSPALKNHCKLYVLSSTCDDAEMEQLRAAPNIVAFQVKPATIAFLESVSAG